MHHLNSYFILEQVDKGLDHGRVSAATLFLDISGFTQITEALMKHGQYGAEVLANIISDIFDPLVECIYGFGGDITHFAGDAFQAIFPIHTPDETEIVCTRALAAATFIQAQMQQKATFATEVGPFQFTAKVGLSVGELEWGVVAGSTQHIYYFRGTAVDECAQAENLGHGGDIVAHRRFQAEVDDLITAVFIPENDAYARLSTNQKELPPAHINPIPNKSIQREKFIPDSLLKSKIRAEFRYTCNLFLNVSEINSHQEITTFMNVFFTAIEPYDGYINRLAFGDKGCHILIFWGAPTTHENDLSRTLNFALALKTSSPVPIRMGITYGLSHAGYIGSYLREEYTCYGHRVNMAARLMSKADWHTIWMGDHAFRHAQDEFDITYLKDIPLKGVSNVQSIYLLEGHQGEIAPTQYTTSMIGRETELTQLQTTISPIFDQQFAGIITIYGEAGIGKSRLIYELKQQMTQQAEFDATKTIRWLYCPVDEILRQPLNPFRYWMRKYFMQSRTQSEIENKQLFQQTIDTLIEQLTDDAVIQELQRTVSILGAILDLYWPDSLYEQLEPRLRSENRQLALINLIKAETMRHPVILEIEDGHWLDNESKDLIGALTRNLSNQPLVILLTNRYQDDGTVFALPIDETIAQQEIHLNYLSVIGIQQLAEQIVNGTITPAILRFLMDKTNGNPFFTEQLLLDLKERERIVPNNTTPSHYDFRAGFKLADVPANLHAVLVSRLDRLIDETRQIVQMAAVLGQEFDIGVLKAMAVEFDDLTEFISQGENEQIWSAISKILYAFKHALMRDAAYGMQLQSHLQHLHAFAALAYESLYANSLPEHYASLAYHYEQAEIEEKAIEYLKLAGDAAKNSYQNEIALNFYNRLLNYQLENILKMAILLSQGEILYVQGKWEDAIKQLTYGLKTARTTKSLRQEINFTLLLGSVMRNKGDFEEAIVHLDGAKDLAKSINDELLLANILTVKSRGEVYRKKFSDARDNIEKAQVLYRNLNDQHGIARAYSLLGAIYGVTNQYRESLKYFLDAISLFEELGDKGELAQPHHNIGLAYYYLGNYQSAEHYFNHAIAIATQIGNQLAIFASYFRLGQLYHLTDRVEQSINHFQKSIDIRDSIGSIGIPSSPFVYLAWAYFTMGEYQKSLENNLIHFRMINETNRDVEFGMAHLVVGLILSQLKKQSNKPFNYKTSLLSISELTNLPLTPINYFLYAIGTSKKNSYFETLIPAYIHYGTYLIENNINYSEGLENLNAANSIAVEHEMNGQVTIINKACEYLGIHL